MDNFGTGYSSLSYLRRFPFDKLKIDQSFVGDLAVPVVHGDKAAAGEVSGQASNSALLIVRAITGLGSGLGITTTAEGVETVHQFEQMRLEGCTEVQGYFISSPRPAAEISSMCSILDASVSLRSATRQEPSRRVA
jgi:EAL domain-containing protein (putative c-di-GMP-specific phosphodiesterase class I)